MPDPAMVTFDAPTGHWRLANFPVWSPNGIPSRSPGLDREAGLPWVHAHYILTPTGLRPDGQGWEERATLSANGIQKGYP